MTVESEIEHPRIYVNTLFNPAFMAVVIRHCVFGWERTADGRPFDPTLLPLMLPLALTEPGRASLPRTTARDLLSWIQTTPEMYVRMPELARAVLPHMTAGVRLGLRTGAISQDEHGLVSAPLARKPRSLTLTNDFSACTSAAEFVGRWYGRSGDAADIVSWWKVLI